MNILFTSAGRRTYLINYFRTALGNRGDIHIANSDALCGAFTAAGHHFVTPPIYSPEYVQVLLDYCDRHRIGALIPLFDIDLPVLARAREQFASQGTCVVVSDPRVVELCNDKSLTAQWLQSIGVPCPSTYLSLQAAQAAHAAGDLAFPVLVKPRWGMGSIGVMEATSLDELRAVYDYVRRVVSTTYLKHESEAAPDHCVIVQERVYGDEYGLDVLNDLDCRHRATVVKKKLAMRAGETDAAVTVTVPTLHSLGERLGTCLGHRGNLDVDLFYRDGVATVLELNCRFGGGYPFTHLAGADFPSAILAWLHGNEAHPQWLEARPDTIGIKELTPVVYNR